MAVLEPASANASNERSDPLYRRRRGNCTAARNLVGVTVCVSSVLLTALALGEQDKAAEAFALLRAQKIDTDDAALDVPFAWRIGSAQPA